MSEQQPVRLHILVVSNVVLMVLLTVNIAARTNLGNMFHQDLTWVPDGCWNERVANYVHIGYGDSIKSGPLYDSTGQKLHLIDSTLFTHIILNPYRSTKILDELSHHNSAFQGEINIGIRRIIILYKPFGYEVPRTAWRKAEKWARSSQITTILDREGDLVTRLKLDPCECGYNVVLDESGVVHWVGPAKLSNPEFRELIINLAASRKRAE